MLQIIGRGKGAKLRIIPASGKGIRASSNIANPAPNTTEWTEISPGVWQCTGLNIGAATTLFLAQEADGLVIGQAYLLSATITGAADILIRSGSTTLDTNWDGSPKVFTPNNGNFNIFQRAGGYTIQSIVVREAVIVALGVESVSEIGIPTVTITAPAATGIESLSEVGAASVYVGALGVESASEVGTPSVSIVAPAAIGVESLSEVATISTDTTAPTMTGDSYDEGTSTFSATVSEPAIMHYLVSDTQPTTANDIILGTGLLKTTVEVDTGANSDYVEFSTVVAGTHWLGVLPVDAWGNADFAQAHVAQYVFPGGYVATGVESASEVGMPAEPSVIPAATGVESASEVGSPTATIQAPAATGVESVSEIGAASATIQAPAATGIESASEIGAAAPPAGGGASGNYTFSIVQGAQNVAGADPGGATLGTAITEGNLLIAITFERSGGNPANHVVTDTSSGSWTHEATLNVNNAVGGSESSTNLTCAFHWRVVTGSEGDVTPTISVDDGTSNSKGIFIREIAASAAYDWTFDDGVITGTGLADWNGAGSGNATPTGDDILELAYAVCRNSTSVPSTTSFSTQTDVVAAAYGGSNQFSCHIGMRSPSVAAGTKSATNSSNGTGNEGVVGVACFSDGA